MLPGKRGVLHKELPFLRSALDNHKTNLTQGELIANRPDRGYKERTPDGKLHGEAPDTVKQAVLENAQNESNTTDR